MEKHSYNLTIMILVFFCLYSIQGFFFGYIHSLKILMKNNGISYEKLAMLDMITFPLYLKCFFSPFLDIYYFKKFGKRMSYIIPMSILITSLFIYLAFNIDDMIENENIVSLSGIFLVMMNLVCIQDVAIDSLAEEVFSEKDQKWGSMMQTVGQIAGPLISFNLYIYAFDKIDHFSFYFPFYLGMFIVTTSCFSYFVTKENLRTTEFNTALQIFKEFPKFITNTNIRRFIMFNILFQIYLAYWSNCYTMKLIEKGFDKDKISEITLVSLVTGFFLVFWIGKFDLSKNLFKIFKISFLLESLIAFLEFLNLMYFDYTGNQYVTAIFVLILSVLGNIGQFRFTTLSVYTNLICDVNLSGTYISVINAMRNFSHLFFNPFYTYILKYDYKSITVLFISFNMYFIIFIMPKYLDKFSKLTRKDYALKLKTD